VKIKEERWKKRKRSKLIKQKGITPHTLPIKVSLAVINQKTSRNAVFWSL
jgi:uncharacterized protein YceH (UPF0502 family)